MSTELVILALRTVIQEASDWYCGTVFIIVYLRKALDSLLIPTILSRLYELGLSWNVVNRIKQLQDVPKGYVN